MKHLITLMNLRKGFCFGLALGLVAVLAGCEEVNVAVDSVLGIQSPVLSASAQTSPRSLMPAKKRLPGEKPESVTEGAKPADDQAPVQAKPAGTAAPAQTVEVPGKRRAPGQLSPISAQGEEALVPKEAFVMGRDPFEQPTEILPTECPPSMPLCRFDRSQLKLVGVIQVSDGQFKGMVEDPDGRGYFISTGMQIGGGTVTQVTNKGITLHLHKNRQDVVLPLYSEAAGGGEF